MRGLYTKFTDGKLVFLSRRSVIPVRFAAPPGECYTRVHSFTRAGRSSGRVRFRAWQSVESCAGCAPACPRPRLNFVGGGEEVGSLDRAVESQCGRGVAVGSGGACARLPRHAQRTPLRAERRANSGVALHPARRVGGAHRGSAARPSSRHLLRLTLRELQRPCGADT